MMRMVCPVRCMISRWTVSREGRTDRRQDGGVCMRVCAPLGQRRGGGVRPSAGRTVSREGRTDRQQDGPPGPGPDGPGAGAYEAPGPVKPSKKQDGPSLAG